MGKISDRGAGREQEHSLLLLLRQSQQKSEADRGSSSATSASGYRREKQISLVKSGDGADANEIYEVLNDYVS